MTFAQSLCEQNIPQDAPLHRGCLQIIRHVYRGYPIRLEEYTSGWLAFGGRGNACLHADFGDRATALAEAKAWVDCLCSVD
jgi:hypothetical protein